MVKRPYYGGSIFEDRTKKLWTWAGKYRDYRGEYVNKKISAKTQRELRRKVDEFFIDNENSNIISQSITVARWIDKWLDIYVKPTVKYKTYVTYRDRLKYVKNNFGNRRVKTLNTTELQVFFNELRISGGAKNQGLAADSVNHIRRYLKMALDSAIKNGYLVNNPVEATKPQKVWKKEIIVLDEKEVKVLLDVAKSGEYITFGVSNPNYIRQDFGTKYLVNCYYNLINLALATGMRFGELIGLQWCNVDFTNNKIHIEKQIVVTNDSQGYFDTPKSMSSRRVISVDEEVLKDLKIFKNTQEKLVDFLGEKYKNKEELVFTNCFGNHINRSNFNNRYFKKMLGEAGISSRFKIHNMRHTHATLLLKHGVNIKIVSERLGHSNPTVTLNVYAHVLKSMETTASDMWSKIIKNEE